MVASTSAFISTTGLPWRNASRMTWAPNSTEPVTSTTTSISGRAADGNGVLGDDRLPRPHRLVERRLGAGGHRLPAGVAVDAGSARSGWRL